MRRHGQLISEAYQALREGGFQESLELCQRILEKDQKNYWAAYLEAVALGYLGQRAEFLIKVNQLEELSEESTYATYLQALSQLWQSQPDLERALWHWAQIANQKEGWLAKELLEKARKKKPLIEMAGQGHIADFIILPDFLQEIPFDDEPVKAQTELEQLALVEPENENGNAQGGPGWVSQANRDTGSKIIYIVISAAFLMAAASVAIWQVLKPAGGPPTTNINQNYSRLSISESAHVLPQKRKALFLFENRNLLIEDFNNSKQLLRQNRINQARYLLNRIILSNADFKSKEKSKIFLKFIPVPRHDEFIDNLDPDVILKKPQFYVDCLVLWQGRVLSLKTVDKGKSARLIVESNDKEYLVEAFLKTEKSDSSILDIKAFGKEPPAKAIVYGTFKGLVGAQQALYIEMIKMWK